MAKVSLNSTIVTQDHQVSVTQSLREVAMGNMQDTSSPILSSSVQHCTPD